MWVESQKRRQSPERSCLPTAAALPSGEFGTSPPTPTAAYLSPTGVANSKGCCHLSNASFDARRSARLPTAARPCAAISRERRTTILAFAASKKAIELLRGSELLRWDRE